MFIKILFAMRVTHVVLCVLPIHDNQHWQHAKNYKNQELGNKMESDTEHSTVQDSKDREINLISRKVWRKIKEKVFKRRNWLSDSNGIRNHNHLVRKRKW